MKPYVIRPGDYLKKVALTLNVDADTVWNDPKNAELKASRDPNQLHPGDVLWVPDSPRPAVLVSSGKTNKYRAKVPATGVKLCFKGEKGPLANEPFTVEGPAEPKEGKTDGAGRIELSVPVDTREVRVVFPGQRKVYPVQVGDMDPPDEPSGVRKRLHHLGYLPFVADADPGDDEAADRDALCAFQSAKGLPATGKLDAATKAALLKDHGS
jgi:hypothetical protein